MAGALVVGVLIVVFVAVQQLGGKVSGTLKDPGTEYPAALIDGNALGKATAPVTLEVWEDFQCPFCGRYSLSVEPVLVSRYVNAGTLRIVHHDFDLLGGGRGASSESRVAAGGAQCALKQDAYWPYAHWVYANQDGENQGGFSRDRLVEIAAAAGLDRGQFQSCLDDPATYTEVDASTAKAAQLGINSTPTMLLNGTKIDVSLDPGAIGAQIEQAAASASPSGASPSPSGAASPGASAASSATP